MNFATNKADCYRVEVSGWDERENFFVEKTTLDWGSGGRKEIFLKTLVRMGSILFVRLLQPLASENNFPITYQTMNVAENDKDGQMRISVEQLRPRTTRGEKEVARAGSTTMVA
jgi:hypothetical protein